MKADPIGYWMRDDANGRCLRYVHGVPVGLSRDSRWAPLYDQAALDAAVAAERERCAMVCETLQSRSSEYDAATLDCAAAIRAGA